jgi:hypothetical protein
MFFHAYIPSLPGGRLGQRSLLSDILQSSCVLVAIPARFPFQNKGVFESYSENASSTAMWVFL